MGPLHGIKVVEMAGIGPGPFAGMLLADMGAEVIRVDRLGAAVATGQPYDFLNRGRKSIQLDLKQPEAVELLLTLIAQSDAIFEGFRPGVMEKLGLGPEQCLARNDKLVYGRMTGWGQEGPLSQVAGHDINYIAITGALDSLGVKGEAPVPPMNLLGDFGGGAMYLVMGMLAAILSVKNGGKGQVVDAAICDGTVSLMCLMQSYTAQGLWMPGRGQNLLDGGAPFYACYETKDGKWISFGALEPKFYQQLIDLTGCDSIGDAGYGERFDRNKWPEIKANLAKLFKTRTRDEWDALLGNSDACYAPVLEMHEAPEHPHNKARGNFLVRDNVVQTAPAPRFSETQGEAGMPEAPGGHTDDLLAGLGLSAEEIATLKENSTVA